MNPFINIIAISTSIKIPNWSPQRLLFQQLTWWSGMSTWCHPHTIHYSYQLQFVTIKHHCAIFDNNSFFSDCQFELKLPTWINFQLANLLVIIFSPWIYQWDDLWAHTMQSFNFCNDRQLSFFTQIATRLLIQVDINFNGIIW